MRWFEKGAALGCDAVFLEAALGFFGEGVFDEARSQKARHQIIEVASGFGFPEFAGKICFR